MNKLIAAAKNAPNEKLKARVAELELQAKQKDDLLQKLTQSMERAERVAATKVAKLTAPKRTKSAKHLTRVIIPDSHGAHIDPNARDAFLADLKLLHPDEIIMLGDHLDCGGTFNTHQVNYSNEMTESYEDDVTQANAFLDAIRAYSPNARIHYLAGNHESHVERWASRSVRNRSDADFLVAHFGPEAVLKLKAREITYYLSKEFHMGLAVRGAIKIGKCFFTHGISHAKHADDAHLHAFSGNVVFGHVHRALEVRSRTVESGGFGAWSPGTLAKLQPLYRHTECTSWVHGYGLQFANANTGRFSHFNVPIFVKDCTTGLEPMVGALTGGG